MMSPVRHRPTTDRTMRKIIHIDMDCFFAAVEMRTTRPSGGAAFAIGNSPTDRRRHLHLQLRAPLRGALRHAERWPGKLCPPLVLIPGR